MDNKSGVIYAKPWQGRTDGGIYFNKPIDHPAMPVTEYILKSKVDAEKVERKEKVLSEVEEAIDRHSWGWDGDCNIFESVERAIKAAFGEGDGN